MVEVTTVCETDGIQMVISGLHLAARNAGTLSVKLESGPRIASAPWLAIEVNNGQGDSDRARHNLALGPDLTRHQAGIAAEAQVFFTAAAPGFASA